MSTYPAKVHSFQSGKTVIIRSAISTDATEILSLNKSVIEEEIYHLTSKDEFTLTVEEAEKWVQSHVDHPYHLILVAEIDNQIIGSLDFSNGHRQRNSHTGYLGMSVAAEHRDQGIGTLLLIALFDWAKSTNYLEKIYLKVHGDNERAKALYKKMGFEVEAVKHKDMKYGPTEYVDTLEMAIFI